MPTSFIGTKLLAFPSTGPLPGPIKSTGGLEYAPDNARLGQAPVPAPVQHAKGVAAAVHRASSPASLPKVPSVPPVSKVLLLSLVPPTPVAPARPTNPSIPGLP